jgi:hypothetical protein
MTNEWVISSNGAESYEYHTKPSLRSGDVERSTVKIWIIVHLAKSVCIYLSICQNESIALFKDIIIITSYSNTMYFDKKVFLFLQFYGKTPNRLRIKLCVKLNGFDNYILKENWPAGNTYLVDYWGIDRFIICS